MQLKTTAGLAFPYHPEAFHILQGITPTEISMTPKEELIFVLRAYGQAVTGQHIQVDHVLGKDRGTYTAVLQPGASKDFLRNPNGKKHVAVKQFNRWLRENGFRIEVKPDPDHVPIKKGRSKRHRRGGQSPRSPRAGMGWNNRFNVLL